MNKFLRLYRDSGGEGGGTEITVESLQADIAKLNSKVEGVEAEKAKILANRDEILTEQKAAKKVAKEAKDAADKVTNDKAKADGDHEQLFKSSEEKRKGLEEELANIKNSNRDEKIHNKALEIASSLADGDNVGLLATFIKNRIGFTEAGEMRILDESGGVTVSPADELKDIFANDAKFKSLLRGNQSNGGGADGGGGGGATGDDDNLFGISRMTAARKTQT